MDSLELSEDEEVDDSLELDDDSLDEDESLLDADSLVELSSLEGEEELSNPLQETRVRANRANKALLNFIISFFLSGLFNPIEKKSHE